MLRLMVPFQDRLLFCLQSGDCFVLFAKILLPFGLNFLDRPFDLRNPDRNFFLFLFQLLQGNNLVSQLRKIRGLRGSFAAETNLAFLKEPLLVPQGDARLLPTHFQPKLAESGSNEAHGKTLSEVTGKAKAVRRLQIGCKARSYTVGAVMVTPPSKPTL